ncbi:chloramphenicol acetyltransferase [Neolewinella aurantiaca]|uniref:Chloramphenicol acetyltransferase n=1 Tax=Neolewinella aurantiaca TaxID=2602767 RepID=A0A5C7FX26_9BACT|nr:CatA-like O-acetyltransferase [Neolewinella aurantiaca]TXF91264.1 chloramphenicol acetyltransferase [Neolewinella aurantiaca]
MKKIQFDEHRQAHFAHFNSMANPHFGITAEVDITVFLDCVRRSPTLRFTPAMVYLISRAALEIVPFRWRIRRCNNGDKEAVEIVEHSNLRPSFAVPTATSSAFSFCTVDYNEDPLAFHTAAEAVMERMKHEPSFEDEPGADDYLFLSTFPWASFTSVTHAMPAADQGDSVPRIVWGKYHKKDNKVMMPLAVQAHHAVVDGSDLGRYYQEIQRLFDKSEEILNFFQSNHPPLSRR